MIYNFHNESEVKAFRDKIDYFISKGKTVDLIEKKNTRSTRQNSSLHLLFTIISNQLNEMGMEFQYFGLKGKVMSVRHTPNLVKEHIWRPLQFALFRIKSTKDINTEQINEIVDILTKFFGEKGVVIEFPSKETLEKLIN